jgi:branched-chain amino acid transport system ATP-binding protein
MIRAIKGISFEINQGEIIALIGANGAGKTTTLQTVSGLIKPKAGKIIFKGKDISKVPCHKIVSMGMAHVPEGRRVFAEFTVLQNLKMGAYTRSNKEEIAETLSKVYKRFPRLEERKNQLAGTLSGGEQQMLAMGRALMSKPDIVLMDEPSMGLSPLLVKEIFSIIEELHSTGTTILLVEQNAKMALSVADRAYVLETGNITMGGKASEMLEDERIKKAYLGQ